MHCHIVVCRARDRRGVQRGEVRAFSIRAIGVFPVRGDIEPRLDNRGRAFETHLRHLRRKSAKMIVQIGLLCPLLVIIEPMVSFGVGESRVAASSVRAVPNAVQRFTPSGAGRCCEAGSLGAAGCSRMPLEIRWPRKC